MWLRARASPLQAECVYLGCSELLLLLLPWPDLSSHNHIQVLHVAAATGCHPLIVGQSDCVCCGHGEALSVTRRRCVECSWCCVHPCYAAVAQTGDQGRLCTRALRRGCGRGRESVCIWLLVVQPVSVVAAAETHQARMPCMFSEQGSLALLSLPSSLFVCWNESCLWSSRRL